MILVDVHAHIDFENYNGVAIDIDKTIKDCADSGVKVIVANGVDSESNKKIIGIAGKHPIIKAALGIYPTHCVEIMESDKAEFKKELKFIEKMISEGKCIAIGEVGLDYKELEMTDERKRIMKECLIEFCKISKHHDIPIILHSRNAELDTVELLEGQGMKKVIMHCFSGRKHIVERIIKNGWFFSIPCNVDRSLHFQSIVQNTPMAQLLTETDSPYLSPFPGKINTPKNVVYTISQIAKMKNLDKEEVANIIYNNFQRLFL